MIFIQGLVIVAIILAALNEFYQAKLGVPSMPTMPRVAKRMLELAKPSPGGKIVELGSGWGGLSIAMARQHPQSQVVGIEYSPFPHILSRLRLLFHPSLKNVRFVRADFFKYPLHDTSVVLCYLTNALMAALREKFLRELPQDACVVSSTFFIPDWKPEHEEVVSGAWDVPVYVYRKPA